MKLTNDCVPFNHSVFQSSRTTVTKVPVTTTYIEILSPAEAFFKHFSPPTPTKLFLEFGQTMLMHKDASISLVSPWTALISSTALMFSRRISIIVAKLGHILTIFLSMVPVDQTKS